MKNIWIIACVFLLACNKPPQCFKGTGNMVTETRPAAYFNKIVIEDDVDVYISQDTFYSISVYGGEKLTPWVNTDVSDNTLTITNQNKCDFLRSYNKQLSVHITLIDLQLIEYTATGNIYFEDTLNVPELVINEPWGAGNIQLLVNCNKLQVNNHTGPFDATCAGNVGELVVYTAGNGYIDCSGVSATNTIWADNRGTGDFHVNGTGDLTAIIQHTGNIYYSGSPSSIQVLGSGSGQLIAE